MLELTDLLDRKPAKLSGGQRQRVAMGRAIVRRPRVFCMDEPLSNLDAKLRVSTRSQISGLQRRLGTTTVYVTHDQVEAMTMGDRVAVLKDGVLQQVDTPRALYDDPVNTFVATFIGAPAMNLIDAAVAHGVVRAPDLAIPVPDPAAERVLVGVRPESWDVASIGTPGSLTVHVELVEELGFESFVYATPVTSGAGRHAHRASCSAPTGVPRCGWVSRWRSCRTRRRCASSTAAPRPGFAEGLMAATRPPHAGGTPSTRLRRACDRR